MKTVVAYILTIVLTYFSLTLVVQLTIMFLIRVVLRNFSPPVLLAQFCAAIITWTLLDNLWVALEGGHIPILAYGLSFIALSFNNYINRRVLTDASQFMIGGEQWAIVVVSLISLFPISQIRWY